MLVTDNLDWWSQNGFMEESRQKIWAKMTEVQPELRQYDDLLGVTAFIDNNCLEMAITGAGPLAPGPEAPRYGDEVQRSMYNGWKSQHGVKDQTVDGASGHTWDLYGPLPIRQNDLHLLRESQILHRWKNTISGIPQSDNHVPSMKIFGDSAYKFREHIFTYFSREHNQQLSELLNYALKAVRISIEWNYGHTVQLFKALSKIDKLRALAGKSGNSLKLYTVATLLRNFHVWLYGSQSSNYFEIYNSDPKHLLEKYIKRENL